MYFTIIFVEGKTYFMSKKLFTSILLPLLINVGYSHGITVAFRTPYMWVPIKDSVLKDLRTVLKQEKIAEVRDHAKYRIYIIPQSKVNVKEVFKINVEKGNITISASDDSGLINGVQDITEQLKKAHSLAGIKSKTAFKH